MRTVRRRAMTTVGGRAMTTVGGRAMTTVFFAALLCAVPAAALPPLSASVGYMSDVFTSSDYDLVDDNDHLPMWRFGAGYTLNPGVGALDVELDFHTGATGAQVHQSLQSSLWLRGFQVGATWRYPLLRHLEPYGRLGAGYDWATLSLAGDRLQQTVARPAGNALLGVQVPMPLRANAEAAPAFVLDIGVGYTLRPSYGFHELRPEPPDREPDDAIKNVATNAGSLSLNGFTYRILLTFRL